MDPCKSIALALAIWMAAPAAAYAQTPAADSSGWTPASRAAVLAGAEKALGNYIFADKVGALRAAVERHRNELVALGDEKAFAKALTRVLQTAAGDKHLIVWYSDVPHASSGGSPNDAQTAEMNRFFRYVDYGFRGVARLSGNVGYVSIGGFADLSQAKATIDSAMSLVGSTQALIVDMRGNGGGDSDTVTYLLGYFFPKSVEVTYAVQESGGKAVTNRNFTPAHVGGPRFAAKPVYVLVDRDTISGGEMFAYDIQSLQRATVIGESTAGAANGLSAAPVDLNAHLSISIPDTLLRNPYTGTNWEGVGVKPDVATSGKAALLEAYTRAIGTIRDAYDPAGELAQARKDPAAALRRSLP